MQIEKIDNPIQIKIEKCSIPILFLDSNIIIEFNKVLKEKSKQKNVEALKEIIKTLQILSKSNKIMIPYADQEEEVDYKINESNNIDILYQMSNGNKFKNHLLIQREQKEKLFQAFLNNETIIKFDYTEGFEEINKTDKDRTIFIKGLLNIFGKNTIYELQKEKMDRTNDLLTYQKTISKNEKFKEHLFKEFTYEGGKLFVKIVNKFDNGLKLTQNEKLHWEEFLYFAKKYSLQGDLTDQLLKYNEFLLSFYWWAVPYIDIERNINTYISLYEKFKPGDYKDTINSSCYLPFCNYYFTDNAMCRILKELSIDKKYNVKIYSFKNIVEFLKDLKKI